MCLYNVAVVKSLLIISVLSAVSLDASKLISKLSFGAADLQNQFLVCYFIFVMMHIAPDCVHV